MDVEILTDLITKVDELAEYLNDLRSEVPANLNIGESSLENIKLLLMKLYTEAVSIE